MANRLKDKRVERGLSQRKLATAAGCHQSTIYSIESGIFNPSLELAGRLAKALEVSAPELFPDQLGMEGGPDAA